MTWNDDFILILAALVLVIPHLVVRWRNARRGMRRSRSQSPRIDEAVEHSYRFRVGFALGRLPAPPAKRLAVVTCMDARIPVEALLGLAPGEAHVLRNAGGVISDDALRSLILSHHELGTQEVLIVQHTDCGLSHVREDALRARLERITGARPPVPERFHAFTDLATSVRTQLRRVQAHPWLAGRVVARGFIYDVRTGHLGEIADAEGLAGAAGDVSPVAAAE